MLSEEREKEIRGSIVRHAHVTELLAEIDRLRGERDEFEENYHEQSEIMKRQGMRDRLEYSAKLERENQRLRERIKRLQIVLSDWLAATPTDRTFEYCKINQYQAWNANRILKEDDEAAK